MPQASNFLLYCDHVERQGEELFKLVRQHDLEGVVAKQKSSPYLPEQANWLKIRNPDYSQWAGRESLFKRERKEPMNQWDYCALACEKQVPDSRIRVL